VKKLSQVAAIVMAIAAVAFLIVIMTLGILPAKYILIIAAVLVVLVVLCALPAIRAKATTGQRQFQSVVCFILAALMVVGCVYIPAQKGKFQKLFTPVPTTGTMNIDIYTLKSASLTDVQQLAGKTVAIQKDIDVEYQDWAVKVLDKEITGADVVTQTYSSIYDAAQALYEGKVDALMLNESYVEILSDNSDYADFSDRAVLTYQCTKEVKLDYDTSAVSNVTTQPFTLLIAGQDSTNYANISASAKTRSDVVMILVINPVTKQALVVTVPRDSYVPLSGVVGHEDKITHASTLGINCLIDTVSAMFGGIDVNYFLRINFQSFVEIVNAVGGVTVDNPYYFCMTYKKDKTQNYCFDQGVIEMDGAHALGYVRERKYSDSAHSVTDMGRNKHQALVIKALTQKVTSVSVITKIGTILDGLQGTFTTNMQANDIYALAQMQLDDMADWQVFSYNLTGTTGYAQSYIVGSELSMVFVDKGQVATATKLLVKVKNGGTITEDDVKQ